MDDLLAFTHRRAALAALLLLICLGVGLARARAAHAFTWRGSNPSHNLTYSFPGGCVSDGHSTGCLTATISQLDASLDRRAEGLVPFTGLSARLGRLSMKGVRAGTDPSMPAAAGTSWVANWAGGYPNALLAYQGWMYDDGLGSGNLACTTRRSSGCWGHRHDILVDTGRAGWTMGAAAGRGRSGSRGYAMLASGSHGHAAKVIYTWAPPRRAGAGR